MATKIDVLIAQVKGFTDGIRANTTVIDYINETDSFIENWSQIRNRIQNIISPEELMKLDSMYLKPTVKEPKEKLKSMNLRNDLHSYFKRDKKKFIRRSKSIAAAVGLPSEEIWEYIVGSNPKLTGKQKNN